MVGLVVGNREHLIPVGSLFRCDKRNVEVGDAA